MESRLTTLGALVCGIGLTATPALSPARAADPLPRALATPVTATWAGLPLRMAADRLGEIGGIAVVVDRRIDPDTRIGLRAEGDALADVLTRVANEAGAEAVAYAGHVRLVPRGGGGAVMAAEKQRADELRRLPTRLRTRIRMRGEASWPDGAVPREIVAAATAEAGIVIAGLDDLPHDHFPAARLPPLPLADRIDLLLAHFDRRVEWQPRTARAAEAAEFPIVALAAADADANGGPFLPERTAAAGRADTAATTFTLTVAAPLEELLTALAGRFTLTLDLDRAGLGRVGVAPGEIVRLELRDATRSEVLDAILEPRGLAWRIEGDRLRVSAADR